MASENRTQREIWLALGRICRLFRLNTGKAWISNLGPKGVHRLKDGSIHIEAPRPIPLGFGTPAGEPVVGACDLPGWTSFTVTPEMAQALVGKKIAIFTSIECKASKGGKASDDQRNWATQVAAAGGISGIVNSPEAALQVVRDWAAQHCANL